MAQPLNWSRMSKGTLTMRATYKRIQNAEDFVNKQTVSINRFFGLGEGAASVMVFDLICCVRHFLCKHQMTQRSFSRIMQCKHEISGIVNKWILSPKFSWDKLWFNPTLVFLLNSNFLLVHFHHG